MSLSEIGAVLRKRWYLVAPISLLSLLAGIAFWRPASQRLLRCF